LPNSVFFLFVVPITLLDEKFVNKNKRKNTMKLIAAYPEELLFVTGRQSEVTPVVVFDSQADPKPQVKDEASGKLAWKILGELVEPGKDGSEIVRQASLTILSNAKPVIAPKSDYKIDGDLFVTQVSQKDGPTKTYYKLDGSLVAAKAPAAAPAQHNN
jgi:hypothetical protein